MDDTRTQLAIRRALETTGHYSEVVAVNDFIRVEQLSRLGRAAAAEIDVDVVMDATPRPDGGSDVSVRVASAYLEAAPAT